LEREKVSIKTCSIRLEILVKRNVLTESMPPERFWEYTAQRDH